MKDRVRRPVIAFALASDETLRGSARSVPGIHIRDVLDAIAAREPDLISKFGGHAMAAGLTLERANLDRFAKAFDEEVARWAERPPQTRSKLTVSCPCRRSRLKPRKHYARGARGDRPFQSRASTACLPYETPRVVGDRHLKMWVEVPRTGRSFDAIAFNHIEERDSFVPPEGDVQLVYRLDVNEYQGERRLQLLVDHLLPLPC